jgi:hypothetical protein
MRLSLSGAVSNGGSGGIYEKNCNLINIEKTVEVNPRRIRNLHRHQISQEGEVTEINNQHPSQDLTVWQNDPPLE